MILNRPAASSCGSCCISLRSAEALRLHHFRRNAENCGLSFTVGTCVKSLCLCWVFFSLVFFFDLNTVHVLAPAWLGKQWHFQVGTRHSNKWWKVGNTSCPDTHTHTYTYYRSMLAEGNRDTESIELSMVLKMIMKRTKQWCAVFFNLPRRKL